MILDEKIYTSFKNVASALAGVAQWIKQGLCEPMGHQFDSQSGHMPGLQTRSPVGGMREATTHGFLSLSPSPL